MFKSNVEKAKEKFCKVVGKSTFEKLLKEFKSGGYVDTVSDMVRKEKAPFEQSNLDLLMGKDGVVDLLSKSLFTSRNSNFVKLVKGSITSGKLITILRSAPNELRKDPETFFSKIEKIGNDLSNYLDSTKEGIVVDENKKGEVSSEGETLKRNKNKDLEEKLNNSRLIDKLKVFVTAWLLGLMFRKTIDVLGGEEKLEEMRKDFADMLKALGIM